MSKPAETPERLSFYRELDPYHLTPLWAVLDDLVTGQPGSECIPHMWRYAEVRKFLMEAGSLITAKEAERRVLILENPGLRGQSRVTNSLYAGVQLVNPGEIAPAHRHTQSALRFVIEGSGAHTTVGGEMTSMQPGDFVITPSWEWHDHGNRSDQPMVWLDGLDIPLVQFLDASFAEKLDREEQTLIRPEGDSMARFGEGLLPVDHVTRSPTSPVFNYPYARTREALETLRRGQEWDPCHGLKMRYVNPISGDYAMPTIGAFMQLLPEGFSTEGYRCTDATVFVVVEGEGESIVGAQHFDWRPHDVFIVPSWFSVTHKPKSDAVLFSFSDRPVQQKFGLWREARGKS